MAVDDGKSKEGEKKAQFFNYTAWGSEYNKTAEVVENYVKKGHRLAVEGKLQNKSWEKKDGTKGYATDINVFSVEMLTSKSEAGATPSAPKEEIGEINMPPSEEMPF